MIATLLFAQAINNIAPAQPSVAQHPAKPLCMQMGKGECVIWYDGGSSLVGTSVNAVVLPAAPCGTKQAEEDGVCVRWTVRREVPIEPVWPRPEGARK